MSMDIQEFYRVKKALAEELHNCSVRMEVCVTQEEMLSVEEECTQMSGEINHLRKGMFGESMLVG